MRSSYELLLAFALLLVCFPLSGVAGDTEDPFTTMPLFLNEGPKLERVASHADPFTINKFGDWDTIDSEGLFGDHNGMTNASLDLVLINDAKLEVTILIELDLDQDGDGSYEVTLSFHDIFLPGSTVSYEKRIEASPISMSGNWSDMVNGTARFRIKQDRPYRDQIKLRLSESDHIVLPYHQKVPFANAGEDLMGFDGREVHFNGNGSIDPNGDELTYQWDFNGSDGFQVDAEGIEVMHIYPTPGVYNVTLKVFDGEFYDQDVAVVLVEKRLPPVARAGVNITVDRREVFTLDGSGSSDPNGDELEYEWDIGGEVISGKRVNHSFEDTGEYNITLTVSDGDFSDSDDLTVFVNPNRAPIAVPRRESDQVLASPMIFNGTSSYDPDGDGVKEFSWDFGDGNTSKGPIVNHTFLRSGKINVTLSVFDGIDTGSAILIVNIPLNQPPKGTMKMATYIFDNHSYSFVSQDISDPENMGVQVFWDMGDGTLLEGPLVNHTFRTSGMHQVTMRLVDELGGTHEEVEEFEVLDSSLYLPENVELTGNFSASHGVQQGYYHEVWETTWIGMTPQLTIKLIPEGGARYYRLNLSEGIYNISVNVTGGGNIDVLLMDKANKEEYADYNVVGESRVLDWESYGSSLNTRSKRFQYRTGQVMFLVIGNNGKIKGGAQPVGNVRYDISVEWSGPIPPSDTGGDSVISTDDSGGSPIMAILLLVFILVILILFISGIAALFIYGASRSRKEREEAGMDPGMNDAEVIPPPPITSDEGMSLDDWMNESTGDELFQMTEQETEVVREEEPPAVDDHLISVYEEVLSDPFSDMEDDAGSDIEELFSPESERSSGDTV